VVNANSSALLEERELPLMLSIERQCRSAKTV
jgi:hypothetical protein